MNQLEKDMLLKAPAYVSVLAALTDGKLDDTEKRSALNFAHVKTYSAIPLLKEYYQEAEKVFEKNIEELNRQLPKDKFRRKVFLNNKLAGLEPIFSKLDRKYAVSLHKSLSSFMEHVAKAHNNIITSFFIPIPINGISS